MFIASAMFTPGDPVKTLLAIFPMMGLSAAITMFLVYVLRRRVAAEKEKPAAACTEEGSLSNPAGRPAVAGGVTPTSAPTAAGTGKSTTI